MGSDNSKLQLVLDHFYYTNEKLEGILLIDSSLMQKAINITISLIGKLQIVFEGSYENVQFCLLQKIMRIEQFDKPCELHFSIDLDDNLPPSAFIKRKKMSGEIHYYIEANAQSDSIFGPVHTQKQIIIRKSISEKVQPLELDEKFPSCIYFNDCQFKIKINKTEFSLGEMAEIILDLDNRRGFYNIDYFKITLIQIVNVEEEMVWLKERFKLSSQAITGIQKNEQFKSPQIVHLPIIDKKGVFKQKFITGFMMVAHQIEVSAFDEEENQISSVTIPIVITEKESKCSYKKVNSINGIQSHLDLGKVYFDERYLIEDFHKFKLFKIAQREIIEFFTKKKR